MVHKNCVIDHIISKLPSQERQVLFCLLPVFICKQELAGRYKIVTPKPDKLSFMDRLKSDSRCLALSHTAGYL